MKRLTIAQHARIVQSVARAGDRDLADALSAGYLFLAQSETEASAVAAYTEADSLSTDKTQFGFSLTPRGRAAMDSNEGS